MHRLYFSQAVPWVKKILPGAIRRCRTIRDRERRQRAQGGLIAQLRLDVGERSQSRWIDLGERVEGLIDKDITHAWRKANTHLYRRIDVVFVISCESVESFELLIDCGLGLIEDVPSPYTS